MSPKAWIVSLGAGALTMALSLPASALERAFPPESVECVLVDNGFPNEGWIATKAGRHAVGPALTVRDANNRFITLSNIPKKALARCVFDQANGLSRLWILSEEEARSFGKRK